ncbi:histidine phosphatase family protein [Maritalea porphyrae]|uniref:histidine phosphatase family protein n=1 Tax=Maritalea porphyrae TaxID=880732 RepID=UPI0022B01391|nr:histidine phosphatase family protein [Maritalea porphyrae]MCZ4271114.1 histidine phosphatase family protein [Maritalea porphyrae]
MKIILMRHGRPLFDLDELRGQKFAPSDITQILLDYEQTDLAPDCSPPNDAIELANACAAHFSSQLPRAMASIERLGLRHKAQTDPLFAESSMPHTHWTRPKLDVLIWSVTFRLAWLVGFSQNGESYAHAKQRAIDAVEMLENAAQQHGDVFLLGHGIMNRVLGRELKRRGWRKSSANGSGYWSHMVFEK